MSYAMSLDLMNDVQILLNRARPSLRANNGFEEIETVCESLMQTMGDEPLISDLQVWNLKTESAATMLRVLLPLGLSNESVLEIIELFMNEIDDVARQAYDEHVQISDVDPNDFDADPVNPHR